MKIIPNNLLCFKISQENPEPALDDFYIFDKRNPNIQKYINNTREIKNHLITIKTLLEKKEKRVVVDRYFRSLATILNEFSVCSEFSCFINACDNVLDFVKKDLNLLKNISKRYFKNRILNENVPEEWIQAILDSNSSRKKGSRGEEKLLFILQKKGFERVLNWDDFQKKNKCVAKFSNIFSLRAVRQQLNVRINTKKQNKRLDLIIKDENKIFLLEAKHLNTSGGGQDKQLSELIEILSLQEKNDNIFYISFLDGVYSNILLADDEAGGKLSIQRGEIKKLLKKNSRSYWVNTAGIETLFS